MIVLYTGRESCSLAKRKKQSALLVLAVLIAVLALVIAGLCVILFTQYTYVAGGFREKGNSRLDLRGEVISLSDFEKLTQAFPGREILWDVPLQNGSVASDASRVTLPSAGPSDWEALELMEHLTFLDASGCRDYDRLVDFQARHPQCQVRYSVLLGGREYPNDAQSITLSGADAAQGELLSYMPQLTQVEFTGTAPTEAEIDNLVAAFPHISFRWSIPVGETTVDSAAKALDLHGQKLTGEEIAHLVSRMSNLTQVNLLGCPPGRQPGAPARPGASPGSFPLGNPFWRPGFPDGCGGSGYFRLAGGGRAGGGAAAPLLLESEAGHHVRLRPG